MKGVKDFTAGERLGRKLTFSPFIPHGRGLNSPSGQRAKIKWVEIFPVYRQRTRLRSWYVVIWNNMLQRAGNPFMNTLSPMFEKILHKLIYSKFYLNLSQWWRSRSCNGFNGKNLTKGLHINMNNLLSIFQIYCPD